MTTSEREQLIRYAGVNASDTQAVAVLEGCYDRATAWYEAAGCDSGDSEVKSWIMDLASWFFDNRGRSDAEIPPYIVASVHQLRTT